MGRARGHDGERGADYFPGFEVAAKADVVHVTSNVLARPDDDACAFDADILAAEAESALRRNGFNVVVLQPAAVIVNGRRKLIIMTSWS